LLPVRLRPGLHGLATGHTGRAARRRVDLGRDRWGQHDRNDGPGLGEAGRRRPARHDHHSPGRRVGLRGEAGEGAEGPQEEEVTVAREEEKLKLGKGAAFIKGRFKRLRQEDETWEADFRTLPKPITQSQTHYRGMVVAPDGSLLADAHVEARPTVNDMATLLAHAMRRPLTGKAHRPRRIHVRGHPQWRELFPHLAELGIKVAVHRELPK